MRPRVLLVACAMLATVLAGCANGGGPVDMAAPAWSSGYAWTYAFETTWQGSWQEDGERGNESGGEQGRFVQEVLNTSLSADGEPLYVVGTQQADGQPHVQVIRQRDLSRLPFRWSQTSQCTNGDCTESFTLRNVHTDVPTFLDFPLQRGKRWGGAVDEGAAGDARVVYEASVEGAAQVDTPLGPITTARVVIHAVPDDIALFEQEIRREAQGAGFRIDALRLDFSDHQVIYYSDEYQAIVLHHRESKESFYARGTDPEGQAFEYRSDETERHRSVIEGARLIARPERTMADVGRFMAGQLPLRDPTGQVVAEVGYSLRIDPPHLTVNAGAADEATFTTAIDGELPEDTRLRWIAVSQQGKTVGEGTGPSFAITPQAGRYSVEVESVKEGQVVAAAGASLVANWHRVETLDCGPASVLGCPQQALPVHSGAQSLYVRATPQGPLQDIGDRLRVVDSAGTVIDGDRRGDDFIVDLPSLEGHLVDADPWTVEFEQGIAVASPVELEVQVLYGPAGDERDPGAQVARAPSVSAPWDRA